jgi:glycosyltransferase involved in cell wall biosynthesis
LKRLRNSLKGHFMKRVLILVIGYRVEHFISSVLNRIPANVRSNPEFTADVLVIDDGSNDQTFEKAMEFAEQTPDLNVHVICNPENQGYGGVQKIGYYYAIKCGYDAVIMVHGDGQYPPELIEQMVEPILNDQADAVFGSRMIDKRAALRGHMPFYKWLGNQILTGLQNIILGAHLSEFHSGYRAYRVETIRCLPFEMNSKYYDFDTDIIIQLLDTHKRILEIPIPTFYGREVSGVNGIKYGSLILKASMQSRLMRLGMFYNPKFDYIFKVSGINEKVRYEKVEENCSSYDSQSLELLLERAVQFGNKKAGVSVSNSSLPGQAPIPS